MSNFPAAILFTEPISHVIPATVQVAKVLVRGGLPNGVYS